MKRQAHWLFCGTLKRVSIRLERIGLTNYQWEGRAYNTFGMRWMVCFCREKSHGRGNGNAASFMVQKQLETSGAFDKKQPNGVQKETCKESSLDHFAFMVLSLLPNTFMVLSLLVITFMVHFMFHIYGRKTFENRKSYTIKILY